MWNSLQIPNNLPAWGIFSVIWKNRNLTAEKKPVFIDFTAKWCITCLVNKKAALQSRKFIKLVQEKGIILFRADWTNNDDMITSALERYGRNSIPLYVYYDGTGSEYKILPQLLTPNILEEHLR